MYDARFVFDPNGCHLFISCSIRVFFLEHTPKKRAEKRGKKEYYKRKEASVFLFVFCFWWLSEKVEMELNTCDSLERHFNVFYFSFILLKNVNTILPWNNTVHWAHLLQKKTNFFDILYFYLVLCLCTFLFSSWLYCFDRCIRQNVSSHT